MKQRTLLALGVLLNPQVVILDEPTTALDILTQRAIIDVLNDMQDELKFSIIFISHDLSLAAEMADTVATVYAGEIVEMGGVHDIFYRSLHPYTYGLLTSVPTLEFAQDALQSIPGSPPNLITPPPGCKFHPRCSFATDACKKEDPPLTDDFGTHLAACWHKDRLHGKPDGAGLMAETILELKGISTAASNRAATMCQCFKTSISLSASWSSSAWSAKAAAARPRPARSSVDCCRPAAGSSNSTAPTSACCAAPNTKNSAGPCKSSIRIHTHH